MMSCRAFRQKLIERLGADSPSNLPEDWVEHLQSCPDCARYYEEARRVLAAFEPHEEIRLTSDFKERVMTQIYRTYALEQQTMQARGGAWFLKPAWIAGWAVLLLAAFLFSDLLSTGPLKNGGEISVPSLLKQAWAQEQALFEQDGVLHLVSQILAPAVQDEVMAKGRWLPLYTLDASGKPRFHQLSLSAKPGQGCTVLDEVWYDPVQKRYVRRVHTKDQTIFAAAYDGVNLYSTETGPDGKPAIEGKPVSQDFKAPDSPIEFLGIYPGFASLIDENSPSQVEFVEEAVLEDGVEVRVLRAVTPQPENAPENAMLFKINKANDTLAEIEWRVSGASYLVVRRIKTEVIEAPGVPWNLEGVMVSSVGPEGAPQPGVQSDMIIPNASVRHMAERADFETYLFKQPPSWTSERVIIDMLDLPSPPKRAFMIVYKAGDGRHVVLIQSHTFNQAMGPMVKMGKMVYESPNGFRIWSTPQDQMGATIALQSARSVTKCDPAPDRTGFLLESPAGTFPALAVNGTIEEAELRALIDSLVSAKEMLD
ncbi:MAG: hypothetical protein JXR73_07000 [Candidatus Omnitrophica bacterium]|nr:hypothetical protein [Candidatus Omnitrophota bacterium]